MIDRIIAWASALLVGLAALFGIYLSGKRSGKQDAQVVEAGKKAEAEQVAREKVKEAINERQQIEAETARKPKDKKREDLIRDWSQDK